MVVAEDEAAAVNEEADDDDDDDDEDVTIAWAANDSPDILPVIISLLSFPCS